MTTHVTISVNVGSIKTLHCAYDTLLSFEKTEDSYLKENIQTTYAVINIQFMQRRFKGKTNSEKFTQSLCLPCIVTVKPISISASEMFVSVSASETGSTEGDLSGRVNEFIGEFLLRFSEALENTQYI